ncbi:MAG TPA: hypothetical protein ENK67_03945, partial [Flavobacteriia bacterium]|nr:hypothetical protein [Flavobacteriia bacterium]
MTQFLKFTLFFISLNIFSQNYFPKNDGVKTPDNPLIAFTNATIFKTPTQKIEKGTLVIKGAKI